VFALKTRYLMIFLLLSLVACFSAGGQTPSTTKPYTQERIYDEKGNYQGYKVPSNTPSAPGAVKERFYDKKGNYQGYSTESGGTTYYYNNKSQRIGTSTKSK
jgi:hypothetical protein